MLAAVLKHGCLLHLDERRIELGFASNSVFLESANDSDNKSQLKTICEELFGRKLRVKISSFKEESKIQSPVQLREGENGSKSDKKESLEKALINEALTIFNGKIVEEKS